MGTVIKTDIKFTTEDAHHLSSWFSNRFNTNASVSVKSRGKTIFIQIETDR